MNILLDVMTVRVNPDYHLELEFENGERRLFVCNRRHCLPAPQLITALSSGQATLTLPQKRCTTTPF